MTRLVLKPGAPAPEQTFQKSYFILQTLLETKEIPGAIIEVGIFRGGTLFQMADLTRDWNKTVIGYDTFEGLPELSIGDTGMGHKKGDFVSPMSPDELLLKFNEYGLNVSFIKGLYPDTASIFPISFCHLDVDLYQGTIDSLNFLAEVLNPGGLIVVDDYGWGPTPGVKLAVDEFLKSGKLQTKVVNNRFQIVLEKK